MSRAVATVELRAEIAADSAVLVALAALEHYPRRPDDAFDRACAAVAGAPSLDAVLHAARDRNLLHVCLVVYGAAIRRDPSLAHWQAAAEVARIVMTAQREDLLAVIDAGAAAGLELLVPKGHAFAQRFYPDDPVLMGDVDVLVRPRDLNRAVATIEALGLARGLRLRDGVLTRVPAARVREIERTVAHFGELFSFAALQRLEQLDRHQATIERCLPRTFALTEDGVYRLRRIDLHYSLNPLSDHDPLAHRIDPSAWWEGTGELDVCGRTVRILDDRLAAVVTPYRLYHELMCQNGRGLKPLADLVALLRVEGLDFEFVLDASVRHPATRPALYHVYDWLQRYCDEIPTEVVAALAAPGAETFYSDWGSLWPAVVGVRPRFEVLP